MQRIAFLFFLVLVLALASVSVSTADTATAVPTANLTNPEIAALLYMREEEKLAHDVYVTLATTWTLPTFRNIAQAEQRHMDAVQVLLDRYGLADPAAGHGVGVFTDPTLQALYDQLVAQGQLSLADALRVGEAIEAADIADLTAHIGETAQADIKTVFTNLKRGSESHLQAFQSQLQRFS